MTDSLTAIIISYVVYVLQIQKLEYYIFIHLIFHFAFINFAA